MHPYPMKRSSRRPTLAALLTLVAAVTVLLIAAVLLLYFYLTARQTEAQIQLPQPSTEATVPTEASPYAVSGDDDPASILCKESYTIDPEDAEAAADTVVAACGDQELTNAELQVLYLSEITAFRSRHQEAMPDFSQPLDYQLCPLGDGTLSWQHYFLNRAIQNWHAQQALVVDSQGPQIITEEAFQPNFYQDLHTPNIAPDLPVNDFLYADKDCYTPNKTHQAYLDDLENKLGTLAKEMGYESLIDYTQALFGSGVDAQAVVDAAKTYNTAYMYFTEKSYYVEVSDEDVQAVLDTMPRDEDCTVDIRHILLIPEGAQVAASGRVSATKNQWDRCREQAEKLVKSWLNSYPTNMIEDGKNINFSRVAYENSQDPGSRENGGLYTRLRPGQLISQLDEWCFDEARQPGDYTILRTNLGYHIVFFVGRHSETEEAVRESLEHNALLKLWDALLSKATLTTHFDSVALWADVSQQAITLEEVLYPDIAHERFPEAIVYLQQDYATTSYGSSTVGRGGCGITTMAMLATYMTDELYTPAMLAKDYYKYHDENGTMAELFVYVPAELGFQLDHRTFSIDEAIQALLEGNRVVSLQVLGNFTSAGHYLLLQQYYPDDDTFQVRDSNIANYGKLEGHKVDYFTRFDITSGGTNFFIFQKKVVTTPACTRCGDGGLQHLLYGEYICPKCSAALSRRNGFLSILEEFTAA